MEGEMAKLRPETTMLDSPLTIGDCAAIGRAFAARQKELTLADVAQLTEAELLRQCGNNQAVIASIRTVLRHAGLNLARNSRQVCCE